VCTMLRHRSRHRSRVSSRDKENSFDGDNIQPAATLTSAKLSALSSGKFEDPVDEENASNVTAESRYSRRSNLSRSSARASGKHSATMNALGRQLQAAAFDGSQQDVAELLPFDSITEEETVPAPEPVVVVKAAAQKAATKATKSRSPIRSPIKSLQNAAVHRRGLPLRPAGAEAPAPATPSKKSGSSPNLFTRASNNLKRLGMSAKKEPRPAHAQAANRSVNGSVSKGAVGRPTNLIALSKLRPVGSDVRIVPCGADNLLVVGRRNILYARREFDAGLGLGGVEATEELASVLLQVAMKDLFDVQVVRGLCETSLQLILRATPGAGAVLAPDGAPVSPVHSVPLPQEDAQLASQLLELISENLAAYRRGAEAKRQNRKSRRASSTGSVASNMSCTASECGEFDAFEFTGAGAEYWAESNSCNSGSQSAPVVVPLTAQKLQSRDRELAAQTQAQIQSHRQPFRPSPATATLAPVVEACAVPNPEPVAPALEPVIVAPVRIGSLEQPKAVVSVLRSPSPPAAAVASAVQARGTVATAYLSNLAAKTQSKPTTAAAAVHAPVPVPIHRGPASTDANVAAPPAGATATVAVAVAVAAAPVTNAAVETASPSSSPNPSAAGSGAYYLAATYGLVSTGVLLSGGYFCFMVWHRVLSPQQRGEILPHLSLRGFATAAMRILFPSMKPALPR
jgi:hypothetical protein